MGFTIKEVASPDTQSAAEVEEKLINDAEAKHEGVGAEVETTEGETPVVRLATETTDTESADAEEVVADTNDTPSLSEDEVLSFLKNKYGREAASLDEFTAEPESSGDSKELPEDVAAYLQYTEATGRGMQDYLRLNRDVASMDSDTLLKEYFTDTETDLDAEDIQDLMNEFKYDEELDEDKDVRKVKRAKKKAVAQAKEYFVEQSKMYAEPTSVGSSAMSEADTESFAAYKETVATAETTREANEAKSNAFDSATNAVFGNDFKGFDFNIDGNDFTFNAGTAAELKTAQSTPMNFIGKFMDESGVINDAAGYHKALNVAMNPTKFAEFFYEQGQANAKDSVIRGTKNINMGTRTAPEVSSKGGTTIKALHTSHGRGLKIKSRK